MHTMKFVPRRKTHWRERGKITATDTTSICMECIVHIVYHSFPFDAKKPNSFTHSQRQRQRRHAQACPVIETHTHTHIHTQTEAFTFMRTWCFMNEFLSRFSRQRTKYRLTYISVMSLFVHCWACSCTLSLPLPTPFYNVFFDHCSIQQTVSFIQHLALRWMHHRISFFMNDSLTQCVLFSNNEIINVCHSFVGWDIGDVSEIGRKEKHEWNGNWFFDIQTVLTDKSATEKIALSLSLSLTCKTDGKNGKNSNEKKE